MIAQEGWVQMNGGWSEGLMGALTRGALSVNGIVDCVILDKFVTDSFPHDKYRNVIITKNMRDRKTGLYENAQAFIALPGGIGTLDELAEVICLRQLSFHVHPIIMINTDGYYEYLKRWFEQGVERKFVDAHTFSTLGIVDTIEEAIQFLKDYKPVPVSKDSLHGSEVEAKLKKDSDGN